MATGRVSKYMSGTDSGWLEYTNTSVFSGKIYYRKVGSIVFIESDWINLKTALSAGSYVNLAENNPFPNGYRPANAVVLMGFINSGSVSNRYLPLSITGGPMYIYSAADVVATTYNLRFSGSYLAA